MWCSDGNRHVYVVAAEVAESVIFASRWRLRKLRVFEDHIVMRLEVERTGAIGKVPLKHQTSHPSYLARQLHDHFLEDGVTSRGAARPERAVIAVVWIGIVSSDFVEIRNCQNVISTVDSS